MLHGQTRYNLKSRFFEELPEACLKWLTPQQPAWNPSAAGAGGGWQGNRGGYGTRGAGARAVLQPAWSPGWASGSDPKGLGGKSNPEPDRGTDIKAGLKPCFTTSSARARCWRWKARAPMRARR